MLSYLLVIFGEVNHRNECFAAEEGIVYGAMKEDVLFFRLNHIDPLFAQIVHNAVDVYVSRLNGLRRQKLQGTQQRLLMILNSLKCRQNWIDKTRVDSMTFEYHCFPFSSSPDQ